MGYITDTGGSFVKHLIGGSVTRVGMKVSDLAGKVVGGDGVIGQAVHSTVTDVLMQATMNARSHVDETIDKAFDQLKKRPRDSTISTQSQHELLETFDEMGLQEYGDESVATFPEENRWVQKVASDRLTPSDPTTRKNLRTRRR